MSDVIVIGAGANGLAAAVELARSGKKVLVLEARETAGGLSGRRAFGEGFSVPGIRHDTSEIRPALIDALALSAHGLSLRTEAVPVLASEAEGTGLVLHASPDRARDEIARRSKKDADAYAALRGLLARVRPVLEPLVAKSAPPLLPRGLGETFEMGLMGLKLRGLGREDMIELLRVAPMCVADWMREMFETELLSAALSLPAVLGDFAGPWSPGTAALLILRESLFVPGVVGGPAAVVDALGRALAAAGGQVRTGARVAKIKVEAGRARGVVLASGEELSASAIVAACTPQHTLLDLLPPMTLSVRDQGAARTIRARGTAAKIHLGLSQYPSWRGRSDERFEAVRIGEHLDDLERSFDAAKYRRLPAHPALDVWLPSIKAGERPVMSVLVLGAPYHLDGGWTAESKATLLETVLAQLERHAPGLRSLVVAREVLSPLDLEREYGATGGCIHHVERGLDQLVLLRPARPFARGTTPVEGLFLGSSGCHPGPGVTLAPGVLAARSFLGA